MAKNVFNSIEELESYMTGYANGLSVDEAKVLVPLVAETLKKNIQHHIDGYYASYSPSGSGLWWDNRYGYVRTNKLRRSLDNVSIDITENSTKNRHDISCEFTFDEDMARSESILNELSGGWEDFPQYEGNRVDLIQGGWQVKKNVWFKNIEHFGYQEGYDFIGKAINDTFAQIDTKDMIDIYVTGARNVSANSPYVHIK